MGLSKVDFDPQLYDMATSIWDRLRGSVVQGDDQLPWTNLQGLNPCSVPHHLCEFGQESNPSSAIQGK